MDNGDWQVGHGDDDDSVMPAPSHGHALAIGIVFLIGIGLWLASCSVAGPFLVEGRSSEPSVIIGMHAAPPPHRPPRGCCLICGHRGPDNPDRPDPRHDDGRRL